jgi:hypothetical protein
VKTKCALFLALLLTACTKTAPEGTVPKAKWIDAMTTAMPTMICAPKGFFRSCFDQTEDECLERATRAAKACLIKFDPDLPADLKQPEEGEAWGKKVGACTGETMEIALAGEKKARVSSASCQNPEGWSQ